jgi:hypothetical protein
MNCHPGSWELSPQAAISLTLVLRGFALLSAKKCLNGDPRQIG